MPEAALGAELGLLLLLCRPHTDARAAGLAREMAAQGRVDYGRLERMALFHGVASLLYRSGAEIPGLPEAFLDRLRKTYVQTAAAGLIKAIETRAVLAAMGARGIPCVPLKGPLAAEAYLGDAALYPSADIDVLVRPRDLRAASEVLASMGYAPADPREADLLATHYHIACVRGAHIVELHWSLVKRYVRADPEFWWEGCSEARTGGARHAALEPGRLVLYLIFRLYNRGFCKLKFFVLLAAVVDAHAGGIDWPALLGDARRMGMRRMAVFSLRMLGELQGTVVPEAVLGEPLAGYARMRRAVLRALEANSEWGVGKLAMPLFLDSPFAAMRAWAGRLAPSRAELRLRYGLPEGSRWVYAYYFLNPVLLPWLLLRARLMLPRWSRRRPP